MACYRKETFSDYFHENMESILKSHPLPLPEVSQKSVIAAITTAIFTADKLKGSITVAELIGAGTLAEIWTYTLGIVASNYIGLMIGSAVVAAGRVAGCGAKIQDAFAFMTVNNINYPDAIVFFNTYPGILNPSLPERIGYLNRMTA